MTDEYAIRALRKIQPTAKTEVTTWDANTLLLRLAQTAVPKVNLQSAARSFTPTISSAFRKLKLSPSGKQYLQMTHEERIKVTQEEVEAQIGKN